MSAALMHRASAASVAGLRATPRRAATTTSTSTSAASVPASRAAAALCVAAAATDACERRRDATAARFFNFGKGDNAGGGAGAYGSQSCRDDYCADDVEHYFNYMGMLADEGNYDRMEAMMGLGTAPVDVLLLMAAAEGDAPKVEELLGAGADAGVLDGQGRSPRDLATKPEVVALLDAKTGAKA